jgi:DNA-3-methyladenine glycosylase II
MAENASKGAAAVKNVSSKMIVTAQRFLSNADPVMKTLIEQSVPFGLKPDLDQSPFEALVRAVASQQLHAAAAEAILGRFIKLVPGKTFPEPDDVETLTDDQIRTAGFSKGKIQSIRDLTAKVLLGVVPSSEDMKTMDDNEIVSRITQVRGIGRWTVEMLLIFKLGRMDVLPADDFGVRKGFSKAYGLSEMPKPKEILLHGEIWRPYRTIASWYLWRAAYE